MPTEVPSRPPLRKMPTAEIYEVMKLRSDSCTSTPGLKREPVAEFWDTTGSELGVR